MKRFVAIFAIIAFGLLSVGYLFSSNQSKTSSPEVVLVKIPKPVTVNGVQYYFDGDKYYKSTSEGLTEVKSPYQYNYSMAGASPVNAGSQGSQGAQINFKLTCKDDSSVTVALKQQGTRWVGQNGEYYDKFPSADQLKATYCK